MMIKFIRFCVALWLVSSAAIATAQTEKRGDQFVDKFRQLEETLPTPNAYRTASGAPGHEYWQQQADYKMSLVLDDEKQRLDGDETITYTNNSPDVLTYLWLQLDQNNHDSKGVATVTDQSDLGQKPNIGAASRLFPTDDYGFKIMSVTNEQGGDLKYRIVETMMRVELPRPLKKGEKFSFKIKWWFNIIDRMRVGGRSGWEHFEEEDNYLYTIAQHYPRMCVYSDVTGWQHKQFLGAGEFTLSFGNYEVRLTVPADHIVGATGTLQNAAQVLTPLQQDRWKKAQNAFDNPVLIVTEGEAREMEKTKSKEKKTWVFKAENVRDVAFCSSRKFIWDAMAVKQAQGGANVMAMSYYPKEGNPLWEKYSTKAVAHTLKWYSHHTFDYPYPVAISVHTNQIGMEYPMICFNGGRPEKDGTYSERTKYGMISVIIHEVGHNYFPMIVNSDERQWTWMDEGLNSFLEFLAEQQWERDYPSRGFPANITDYMKGDPARLEPIMTNSESLRQFGNNAYSKPATALNILRETVMGRENFDYAFKTYANRWKFKSPMPADFFRSMEDASAIDLDWFWRGWFFTTEYVDVAIADVKTVRFIGKDLEAEVDGKRSDAKAKMRSIISVRNEKEIKQTQDEKDKELRDYYSDDDVINVSALDREDAEKAVAALSPEEKAVLEGKYTYYEVTFEMKGELLSPVIVELQFADGTSEYQNIPAEIWKLGGKKVKKVFRTTKEVKRIQLDPYLETADVDVSNNAYPSQAAPPTRFELFKQNPAGARENPMQRAKRNEKLKKN
ncbi:MAG: hypothetical protein RL757_2357 [Bacteroidota bacterium]|jgi:hypothetical protein